MTCCWEKSWFQQSRLFWKESKRIVCNCSGRWGGKNLRSWSWVRFRETNILISQRREAKRGSSWEDEERLRRDWKWDFWEGGRPVFLVFQRVERIWFSVSSDFMQCNLCSCSCSCSCTSCSIPQFSSLLLFLFLTYRDPLKWAPAKLRKNKSTAVILLFFCW